MGISHQDDELNQWETEKRSFDERMSTPAEVRQLSGLYLLLAGNTVNCNESKNLKGFKNYQTFLLFRYNAMVFGRGSSGDVIP